MGDRLKDKVALITGAGSIGPGWGNGKAASVLFAREGARVFAVDRNPDAVAETRAIIESEGGVCESHVADVLDTRQVDDMIAACLARFGRIDVLDNNVGGPLAGGPVELTDEQWDAQMNLNLRHVFTVTRRVLPIMERQGGGSIINIGSTSGVTHTGQYQIAYCTAKAAIVRFSRAVALQYAAKLIRCNTVIPGLMHTPMVEATLAGQQTGGDAAELIRRRNARIPMGFMGTGWDVAHAALFFASEESRYVTGAELVVDGALTLKAAGWA